MELSNLDIPATEFTPFEIDEENQTILNKIDIENGIKNEEITCVSE